MLKNFNTLMAAVIAATFAFGALATPASADAMDDWKHEVMKSVAKNQKYPRAALAREIEGTAKVRLVIAADGTITAHEVLEETGESVLDREIPKLVERLNPLPALPEGTPEMSLVLPLTWALR
ncbi:MAG: energy transducer TonB [Alphaproteobacteria bacterium]|nr:MAG: energy transducer TonB [Alphaproteobacteria bacterium]